MGPGVFAISFASSSAVSAPDSCNSAFFAACSARSASSETEDTICSTCFLSSATASAFCCTLSASVSQSLLICCASATCCPACRSLSAAASALCRACAISSSKRFTTSGLRSPSSRAVRKSFSVPGLESSYTAMSPTQYSSRQSCFRYTQYFPVCALKQYSPQFPVTTSATVRITTSEVFTRDFRIMWHPDMGMPAPSSSTPDITTDIVFLAIN
ncbi:Uncharacterised protein [Escherichia coli]|nr:Uncharacterised protein [Escherichia coli]